METLFLGHIALAINLFKSVARNLNGSNFPSTDPGLVVSINPFVQSNV